MSKPFASRSYSSRGWLPLLFAAFAGSPLQAGAPPDRFGQDASAFFEHYCLDCHEKGTTKGGLNLEKANPAMSGPEQAELWTHIFDRLAKGEMPPSKKPQPTALEREKLLGAIRPRLLDADRLRREVVQRRLNRIEYENTVRDLLGIDLELQQFLPADQQLGGFDNNGSALAISTEQMQGYLEAARASIDAAIVSGPQPKSETVKIDSLNEVKQYIENGEYGYVDGRVVRYVTEKTDYSKISTRAHKTTERGRYRFKFMASAEIPPADAAPQEGQKKANQGDSKFASGSTTGYFSVTATNFGGGPLVSKNLGYFEVGPEPKLFEIEAVLDAKSALQFFALGLPEYVKTSRGVPHRGVGFGEVEMTGPLNTQWPPESHTRLLGKVDLRSGTIVDAEMILRKFLPRAFRRGVAAPELERYVKLVRDGLESKRSFYESLRNGLSAALCSPNFLFLREDVVASTRRVSDFELACRLSYFFWSTMPDEELFGLASSQRLHQPAVLSAQVERLLKDPRSEALIKNFVGQWLRLRQINDTTPDRKLYGKFDDILQVSMVREGESFFRQLVKENLSIVELLDSDWAMLNERLANHYGIEGVKGFELRKVSLPVDSVRGGVLTQAGVLKVTANGTTTSPVLRGVWVLENILGQPTPPPPPNVAGIEPDIRGAITIREQLEKHRNVESCNACHKNIDPPGFALESFDPIGDLRGNYLRWVVTNAEKGWGSVQPGVKVDSSGKTSSGDAFNDVRQFKKLLSARRNDFAHCLSEKLLTYGLGRETGFSDREAIEAIAKICAQHGYGLRTLLHAIAESETFATR